MNGDVKNEKDFHKYQGLFVFFLKVIVKFGPQSDAVFIMPTRG